MKGQSKVPGLEFVVLESRIVQIHSCSTGFNYSIPGLHIYMPRCPEDSRGARGMHINSCRRHNCSSVWPSLQALWRGEGPAESDTMSSKTIHSNIQQPMTKQVKFGISEVEDENEAFNLALLGYTYAAYAWFILLRAVCDLWPWCWQDVLMQCVFGSRKSKAWRPVLQVFKDLCIDSMLPLKGSVFPGTDHLWHRAAVSTSHLSDTSGFNSCSFTKSTRWPRWPCLENWNSSCEAHPHQWTEPTHLQAFWPISIWRPSKSCFALLQYASIIR